MRARIPALLAAVTLLSLTACTAEEPAAPSPPPVRQVVQEAAAAGGACILWDYDFIAEKIGVTFTAAAAFTVDETSTCVVQTVAGEWPYLALSVVESTKADAGLFADTMTPAKATKTKGLGKAGYRLQTKAGGGHGPAIEITWLSEAKQVQTLRYTFAAGAKTAEIKQMQTRLLSLAKAMNTTNG